ncbi:MAG: SanA protein [Patescibacteria group bacterium]|nr:SanA protein [Patescibacteria group bacterium]
MPNGLPNAFFEFRMSAAADLYKNGKVDCLLVSGDNATKDYNEIKDMQLSLMEKGVPPERIIGDYAGFRTLDSVIRAKEVFGLSKLTVISQSSHAERALFVARIEGIDAVAYEAE